MRLRMDTDWKEELRDKVDQKKRNTTRTEQNNEHSNKKKLSRPEKDHKPISTTTLPSYRNTL